MLDYERYSARSEIDTELRYSNIYLKSFDSSAAVQGHSDAQTLSFWSRYRAPTGIVALERPLRYKAGNNVTGWAVGLGVSF